MIAHELAHLRRHDLAWNWLPTVVTWLFFFHPLVWVMLRRWSEVQEAACDEMLIQKRVAQPADYGRLLLKLSACSPFQSKVAIGAAGVLGAYRNLRQRMLAMTHVKPFSARHLAIVACILFVSAVVTVIPWRLVAQEPNVGATPTASGAPLPAGEEAQQQEADPAAQRRLDGYKNSEPTP